MHDDQDASERFTDEEAGFLRFAQFGELPPRVMPNELVETVETEQPWQPTERPFDFGPADKFLG